MCYVKGDTRSNKPTKDYQQLCGASSIFELVAVVWFWPDSSLILAAGGSHLLIIFIIYSKYSPNENT